jgi:tetratricopeptide (TPR) repeat protein
MNNLAKAYQDAGKEDLALPLFEEILALTKKKQGAEHPDTLTCMSDLAVAYWQLKRLDRSIPLFEEALKLSEKKLGRQHPETLRAVTNLGVNYKDAGRLKEALPLLEEAYRAGTKHPQLRWVVSPLFEAHARAGNTTEAAKLIDEALADARKELPRNSPQLAGMLAQFGLTRLELKEFAVAEPLLRECLAIREKSQPDAWTTFNTQSTLGGALLGQKKYAEAAPLLLKGYEGMKAREKTIPQVGGGELRIPEALDRLIELYTATDKPDEVKRWRAERAKYPTVAPPPREKK